MLYANQISWHYLLDHMFLVFIALHLSLESNSVFSAFNRESRFHVPSEPNLRLIINLNSEGIFSIMTGTDQKISKGF